MSNLRQWLWAFLAAISWIREIRVAVEFRKLERAGESQVDESVGLLIARARGTPTDTAFLPMIYHCPEAECPDILSTSLPAPEDSANRLKILLEASTIAKSLISSTWHLGTLSLSYTVTLYRISSTPSVYEVALSNSSRQQ